jgi:hypothetical protein
LLRCPVDVEVRDLNRAQPQEIGQMRVATNSSTMSRPPMIVVAR